MSKKIFDVYSEYYNLIYRDKKYDKEAHFIDSIINEYGRGGTKMLDLGCGTGMHDWILSGLGYQVTGLDQSDEMLNIARNWNYDTPGIGKKPTFVRGSLTEFVVDELQDIIVSLFDVVSYLTSYSDFKEMACRVQKSLVNGGLFIFDCWYGPAVFTQQPGTTVKRLENDSISLIRIAESKLHDNSNSIVVSYDMFVNRKKDNVIKHFTETHHLRCYFDDELDALLGAVGFVPVFKKVWFSDVTPSSDNWSVLFGYRLCR